jgi:hypothetical protein
MPKEQARAVSQRRATKSAPDHAMMDGIAPVQAEVGNQEVQRELQTGAPSRALVAQVQRHAGNQAVQRLIAPTLQRSADEPELGERIRAAAGRGSTLGSDVQRSLESGLGASLSGVRVHADAEADQLSRAVNATAFTTGSDIFFRSGAYQPSTSSGMHLLAHEAAHTVQQSRGPVAGTPAPGGVSISDPSDSFERAAEAAASSVGSVQRHPDDE